MPTWDFSSLFHLIYPCYLLHWVAVSLQIFILGWGTFWEFCSLFHFILFGFTLDSKDTLRGYPPEWFFLGTFGDNFQWDFISPHIHTGLLFLWERSVFLNIGFIAFSFNPHPDLVILCLSGCLSALSLTWGGAYSRVSCCNCLITLHFQYSSTSFWLFFWAIPVPLLEVASHFCISNSHIIPPLFWGGAPCTVVE